MFNKSKKSLIALLAAIFAAALLCVGVSLLSPKAQKAYADSGVGNVVQVTTTTTQSYATFDEVITVVDNISNGNVEIKLLADASATKQLEITNNTIYITLDLNGYALTVNNYIRCANLTLKDSMAGTTDSAYLHEISNPTTEDASDTITVYGGVITNPSGYAINANGISVTLESGTVAGCTDSGVKVTYGTFEMKGGTITGNATNNYGAGVYVGGNNAKFTMSGGAITGNIPKYYGGGVYIDNGTFEMTDGTISGNTASNGGGVYVSNNANVKFTMSGGTISGNTADNGGGVYVNGGTFNVSGAVNITENKKGTGENATANNVISTYSNTVVGDLDESARIGFYYTGNVAKMADGATFNAQNFIADREGYIVTTYTGGSDGDAYTGINVVQARAEVTAGSTPTLYATFEEAWTAANNAGTATVTMLADATVNKSLEVAADKNITLILNGKQLKYTGTGSYVPVITVNGTLNLNDGDKTTSHTVSSPVINADVTVNGGLITGGTDSGVKINSTGTFNMFGGMIAGNTANLGGGVNVNGGGIFTMSDGTICHNKAKNIGSPGGGVYVGKNGTFNMSGGTISDNTSYDGSVYVIGAFNISGAPKIFNNYGAYATKQNVFNAGTITVTDALTEGAEIYINRAGTINGYEQSEKPSQYFKSDASTKCAKAGENAGEIVLSAHSGGAATCKAKAVCTHCGESYGDLGKHNYLDGVCTDCGVKQQIYWGVSDDGTTLTISGNASDTDSFDEAKKGGFDFDASFSSSYAPWYSNRETITTVDIKDGVAPACLNYWFYNMPNIESVNLTNLDTSNVTQTSFMFQNSSNLVTVTFPETFDTSKVTTMAGMFYDCGSLTSLDLSSFNTAEVNSMSYMFYNCGGLTSLTFPATFNTAKVTNMSGMFSGCGGLTSLTFPATFDTAKVTTMQNMFYGCGALTDITFSESFKADKVTTMQYMFANCGSLTSLDLSPFNTAEVTNMSGMFNECANLKTVEFSSSFGASKVEKMAQMFDGCKALLAVDLSPFKTDSVTDISKMFYNCEALTSVTFSQTFNTAKVTTTEDMFNGCAALTSLDLSSFDTGLVQVTRGMLTGCDKLATIKTPATIGGSVSIALPATFWNGTADVEAIASASAGKTLKLHAGHSGGTATCQAKATCEICGQEYGELGAHSLTAVAQKSATCTEAGVLAHDHCGVCGKDFIENVEKSAEQLAIAKTAHSHITHHEKVDATTDNAGNYEYWSCEDCDTYFSDSEGTTEIDKASVVIPKITVTPAEKKSYLWLLWLLIPLALAAGGVTYGIYLYKKKKRM